MSSDLRSARELETEPVGLDQPIDVVRLAETRQPDPGRGRGIGRSESDRAPGAGFEKDRIEPEAGFRAFGVADPEHHVLRTVARRARASERGDRVQDRAVPRRAAPATVELDGGVVGQVRAHAGQVDADRDAELDEMVGRPDAGTHEDQRASVGAGGQHDEVRADQRAIVELDRRRATRFEHDRRDHDLGPDDQVRRTLTIGQVGIGGRDAHAVPGAHRHRPGAHRTRLVVILDPRDAQRVERLERGGMDVRWLETRIARDRDRTPIAVPWPVPELGVRFDAPERRQDLGEAPARVPARRPGIEVRRRAADGEPGQPGGAAEDPAAPEPRAGAGIVRL